jgi:hypothetical protein
MTYTDPVKQALAELQDLVRCRCHEAYKGRGLHDPNCHCDSADAVKAVADDLETLDKACKEWADVSQRSYQRGKAAEAKLEMAVFLLTDAMVQLREGKIKTRRNRADIIGQVLEEWRNE